MKRLNRKYFLQKLVPIKTTESHRLVLPKISYTAHFGVSANQNVTHLLNRWKMMGNDNGGSVLYRFLCILGFVEITCRIAGVKNVKLEDESEFGNIRKQIAQEIGKL